MVRGWVFFTGGPDGCLFVDSELLIHLHTDLEHCGLFDFGYAGIITYKDDETIQKGETISEQLIRSIQDSRFYIIVFSKNYVSSSWCLNELVEIMKCQKAAEQTAYPIFFDVEPREVRHQSGAVGEAFAKHVRGSWDSVLPLDCLFSVVASCCNESSAALLTVDMENVDDVGRWRNAMKEAAGLDGLELKNTFNGHEAKFIQQIVEEVSLKLHFFNPIVDGKLVGLETRIWGIGGGGKTTLARAVFDCVSIWFEAKCFVENVREGSEGSGLKELQKRVLQCGLNDKSIEVESVYNGKSWMKRMMGSRKVLLVLDDVDHIDQLEALAGEPTWFKPGSRIIITTRNKQVLKAHQVNFIHQLYFIHDVNLLSHEEAICLFSRYAFGRDIPNQGYEELSRMVVRYANGLPLTIKVLGSHLCSRSEHEWVDAIKRLETIPLKETLDKLELSYIGLENDEKEIFLDIACILKYATKKKAIRILKSCGYHAEIGLSVLEQKSLITISKVDYYGEDAVEMLFMHDHLEELGRNIVRRLHPHEPKRHSRLWVKKEIEDILVNESGTEETKCIKLKIRVLDPVVIMKGLRKMKELRLLYIFTLFRTYEVDEVSKYLPDALESLYWREYPFCCLPNTFKANKLVNLEMAQSNISELWKGGERKVLKKLKFLDFSGSKLTTFDLTVTPHLEELNLGRCNHLYEVHMPVECPSLKFLNLYRSKVSNINLWMTPHLEHLNLGGCGDFVELQLPVECSNLKFLHLGGSKLSNLNLGMTPYLEHLDLGECFDFVELQIPVECLNLKILDLSGSKVTNLNLGMTPHLEKLNLGECANFVELHVPVECPNLKILDLSHSKVTNLNLGNTPHLEYLNLQKCSDFVELHMPVECPNLKILDLHCSKVTNLNLGMTPYLEHLDLRECSDFVELHVPDECPNLKILNLSLSKVTNLNLGMTPYLECLDLRECSEFVELQMPVECPNLKILELHLSKVTNLNLGMTPYLEHLDVRECFDFVELYMPVECPNLKILLLKLSKVTNLNLRMTPYLEYLDLRECSDFVELHMPIACPNLKILNLCGSKEGNLNLGMTPNLERLNLDACNEFELHMPLNVQSSYTLKSGVLSLDHHSNFESFQVGDRYRSSMFYSAATSYITTQCIRICPVHPNNKLPKFGFECETDEPGSSWMGNHEKLIYSSLCPCKYLENWSATICGLPHLRGLSLEGNIHGDVWRLESLQKLSLRFMEIRHLPDSICMLKHLKSLVIGHCWDIEQLPENICRLECLEELDLASCVSLRDIPNNICKIKCLKYLRLLRSDKIEKLPEKLGCLECLEKLELIKCKSLLDIPNNICKMKCLKRLDVSGWDKVEKLPEELGCLECLKELNINAAGISCLPQSIYQLKGLRISGSREQLESCGFTPFTELSN
ncbi:disease resistance protein RPV1-like [Helianthus annuus]|uniref:disease resistance protein RPV1-like n=1 Tax=Helianthus annuus TaxID=4232 RepID=UPI000B8F0710|nr:disease resistance protein RPV1-like [Helianthus annuus]